MTNWGTDRIVGTGLIIALLISIIASIWTGNGNELQTSIASGLLGYLGRTTMGGGDRPQSQTSQTLGRISETASQAQTVVDAVENIRDILKSETKSETKSEIKSEK